MLCLLAMSFAPLAHAWSHPHDEAESQAEAPGCSSHACGGSDHHEDASDPSAHQTPDQPKPPHRSHHACEICIALHTPGGSGLNPFVPLFVYRAPERAAFRTLLTPAQITAGPILFTCGPPTLG